MGQLNFWIWYSYRIFSFLLPHIEGKWRSLTPWILCGTLFNQLIPGQNLFDFIDTFINCMSCWRDLYGYNHKKNRKIIKEVNYEKLMTFRPLNMNNNVYSSLNQDNNYACGHSSNCGTTHDNQEVWIERKRIFVPIYQMQRCTNQRVLRGL